MINMTNKKTVKINKKTKVTKNVTKTAPKAKKKKKPSKNLTLEERVSLLESIVLELCSEEKIVKYLH